MHTSHNTRFHRPLLLATLSLSAMLWSHSAHADVSVVTTVPDLAAIAKEIGGGHVDVHSLSLATQDPHFVDAKPSLILRLNKADLLIAVGLDLELGWLPTLQVGARNAKVQKGGAGLLTCSDHITALDVPAGKVDRSMGDIHPGGSPHYLFDPRAAQTCARAMAERLATLDASHAGDYRANLKRFSEALDKRRAGWEKRMAPYRGQPVITYHKSWAYLLDWLGLTEVISVEPKPGIAPSPRHVAAVIRTARQHKAKVLIQEDYYPKKTGTLVAQKIGGHLVSIPGGTDVPAGESYFQHMEDVVSMLEHAFGK